MKRNILFIGIITVIFFTTIYMTFAPIPKWYDTQLPSKIIDEQSKYDLIANDKYIWSSNTITKNGRCYYYDLSVGYEYQEFDNYTKKYVTATNYTWTDDQRELLCTDLTLSQTELEQLQLKNIAWTLNQLAPKTESEPTQTVIPAQKSENLKTNTIIDKNIVIEPIIETK